MIKNDIIKYSHNFMHVSEINKENIQNKLVV